MRTIPLGLILIIACETRAPPKPAPVTPPDPLDAAWADMASSDLVDVRVERRLYELAEDAHYFIRVRVTNRTDRTVAIDLRNDLTVFYPNQWGGLDEPQRGIIDESFIPPTPLTDAIETRMKADYRAEKLHTIVAGGTTDYFRVFNASGRGDIDSTRTAYLFISIKGQLLVTDGERVESLLPADALYLRTPIEWGIVPATAIVVPD